MARRHVGMVDVAREANVSLGTVSNVFNQPERVSPTTRRRVQDAIDRLGYVRIESARMLRGRPSRILAVLVHDLANPFCIALVHGAEAAARRAGLGVMVCNSAGDPDEEARYVALLSEHQIRGVLITPADTAGRSLNALDDRGIPLVVVDDCKTGRGQCSVAIDDILGGELAATHLLKAGHRSILFIGGPNHLPQVQSRFQGVLKALAQARMPISMLSELACDELTVAAGRDAGARVLGLRDRPTAILCANDLLAVGVLQTLFESGVRVPDDISLVGYDDIDHAAAAIVPLTSVRRPARLMRATAASLLIAKTTVHPADTHHHQQITLRPELAVRKSTAFLRSRPGTAVVTTR